MDRKYIDDHNVIERFILNQLTETELDNFLFYQLIHPEIKPEITEMKHLILGIRSFKPTSSTKVIKKFPSKILILFLILVGLFCFWLFFPPQKTEPEQNEISVSPAVDIPISIDSSNILKDTLTQPSFIEPSPPLEQKGNSPAEKPAKPIASVDFSPNPQLEVLIGSAYRSSNATFRVNQPEKASSFIAKNGIIPFVLKGYLESNSKPINQSFKVFVFSNKEEEYLNFKPLFSQKLTFGEKNGQQIPFEILANLTLTPGLYYFLIEDEEANIYFVSKFRVDA